MLHEVSKKGTSNRGFESDQQPHININSKRTIEQGLVLISASIPFGICGSFQLERSCTQLSPISCFLKVPALDQFCKDLIFLYINSFLLYN
jgi:hypothetical protein